MRLAALTLLMLVLPASPAVARVSLAEVQLSPGAPELRVLDRSFDLTHDVTADRARVLLHDDADRAALAGLYPSREVVADVLGELRRLQSRADPDDSALPSGRTSYRVLSDFVAELDALVAEHPGLVRKVTLPQKSVEGRDITGVEIAKDVNRADDGRPVFVVFGLHHAREWPSGEIALEFARDLVLRYGVQERWTKLLETVRVIVVPVVNPDGYLMSRGSVAGLPSGPDAMQRKNAAEVDLNRNYGAGWGGTGASSDPSSDSYRGPSPFSEPESRGVHELTRGLQITGVESIHNIAGQVLRQPGFKNYGLATPDEARMKEIGDRMAVATGYQSLYGYQLYDVHGATEDWNYIEQGALGFTVELGPAGSVLFMGDYSTHVIEQYVGSGGGGMREALLVEAEAAGEVRDHVVLSGAAPADALLRVRREFTTDTVAVCADTSSCVTPGPVMALPDFVESTLTVGATRRFEWHVGPSTRPWERAAGRSEAWRLTCERPAGTVVATKQVVAGRGQLALVDPCAPASLVDVGPNPPPGAPGGNGGPGAGAPAPGSPAGASRLALSAAIDRVRLRTILREGLRMRLRCSAACTTAAVARVGGVTVARRTLKLFAGRRVRVRVTFTARGRRMLRRSLGRKLEVSLRTSAPSGAQVKAVRTLRLR